MLLSTFLATSLALAGLTSATPAIYRPRDPAVYRPRREPAMFRPREAAVYKPRDPAIYKPRDTYDSIRREPTIYKPRDPSDFARRETTIYKPREPALYKPRESTLYKSRGEGCSPNFEGAAISISTDGQEWSARGTFDAGSLVYTDGDSSLNFHVEQTGQPDTSYIFKPIQNNNVAATVDYNGVLSLQDNDYGNNAHIFTISCQICNAGASGGSVVAGSGCNIQYPPSGTCLVPGADPANDPLKLGPCDVNLWNFSS